MPDRRMICGSWPLYPNTSGFQNSSHRLPNSRSKNRWPNKNWRQSDPPDGILQSGSIHDPPTGTNWPAATNFLIRAYKSGLRLLMTSYWYACEQENLYSG